MPGISLQEEEKKNFSGKWWWRQILHTFLNYFFPLLLYPTHKKTSCFDASLPRTFLQAKTKSAYIQHKDHRLQLEYTLGQPQPMLRNIEPHMNTRNYTRGCDFLHPKWQCTREWVAQTQIACRSEVLVIGVTRVLSSGPEFVQESLFTFFHSLTKRPWDLKNLLLRSVCRTKPHLDKPIVTLSFSEHLFQIFLFWSNFAQTTTGGAPLRSQTQQTDDPRTTVKGSFNAAIYLISRRIYKKPSDEYAIQITL